jgi:hypothetical protein
VLVVPSGEYKWSINQVTKPNPIFNHTLTCDILVSEVIGLETALNRDHYTPYYKNGTNDGTPESHARKDEHHNLMEIKEDIKTNQAEIKANLRILG